MGCIPSSTMKLPKITIESMETPEIPHIVTGLERLQNNKLTSLKYLFLSNSLKTIFEAGSHQEVSNSEIKLD